jgi:hypothetical protein
MRLAVVCAFDAPAFAVPMIVDNGNNRPMTAGEIAIVAAIQSQAAADDVARKSVKAVTRTDIVTVFDTCVTAGGTAVVILTCVRDGLVTLKSQ